ncbi:MAG: hypothetical protein ISQ34_05840, partial [Rickettsiales bacterium]|nr:hypothetical protein [Rickettsiales bacterium]
SSKYKTPNYISEQIIKVVGQREGDFIVISDHIGDLYPVRLIADGGYGDLLSLSYDSLYNFISNSKGQYSSISSQNQYLIDAIKEKILDFSTKTIIVKRVDLCAVGFLEFYFNDLEFKNALLQNYEFDNRIINIETKELDKNLYFGEFYDEEDNRKLFNIIGDYEVYVRKK